MTKSKKTITVPPFVPPPPPRPSVRRVLFSPEFLSGVLAGLLFFFLLANVISSQTIAPLYFDLIAGDRAAASEYLRIIKAEKSFDLESKEHQKIFGTGLVNEVYAEDKIREAKIRRLEEVLLKNPKARDALYALHRLYLEKKDYEKAGSYLRRAQEVDPTIK